MLPTKKIGKADVLKFLDEKDYVISLERISSGCTAKFPQKVLGCEAPKEIEYKKLTQKGITKLRITRDGEKKFLECEPYYYRLLVFFDLMSVCLGLGYDCDLIQFFEDGEFLGTLDNLTFNEFLKEDFPQTVKQKEEALFGLFMHSYNNSFPAEDFETALALGVEEGYISLHDFYIQEDSDD